MNISKFIPKLSLTKHHQLLALLHEIAIMFPAFLVIFAWRGFIQALAAKMVGDSTAKQNGFLTLNPLAHVDLIGLLSIVIGVFFIGGLFFKTLPSTMLFLILIIMGVRWTIPVPINEHNFKNRTIGGIVTSLSGPFAHIVLAIFSVICLKIIFLLHLPATIVTSLVTIFDTILDIALFFGLINLIPLPPFDGGRALRYIFSEDAHEVFDILDDYSIFIFLALFFLPGISDIFFKSLAVMSMYIKQALFSLFFTYNI